DMFARRTNPADADQSLILLKATTQIPHEGGLRFHQDSAEYRLLRAWISAGLPDDATSAPKLQSISATPLEKILTEPYSDIQLQVRALFSDGTTRDITKLAVYDAANNLATINHDGLVHGEGFGETTVLVRYLNRQIPVRLAFVRARPGFVWQG